MKTNNTPTVPFFARNLDGRAMTVRTGLQAGLAEQAAKLCEPKAK